MAHSINAEGLALIKASEGLRLKAYYDSVGVLTIGYGTTNACASIIGTTITPSMTISQATAEEWLKKTINAKYMPKVDKYDSKYGWNDNEASALCSFAYNIGSIDQLTANGTRTRTQIANKFTAYNKAGGKVLAGLTTRREKEKALFLKAVDSTSTSTTTTTTTTTSSSIPSLANATVKMGTRGSNAKLLQQDLNYVLGCSLVCDGIAGTKTITQLKAFQSKNGLVADGIYGAKSKAKMKTLLV